MYDFTVEDVAKAVRSLAVKHPDFIYANQPERASADPDKIIDCSYLSAGVDVKGGKACIVGQALTSLGVSDESLAKVERLHAARAINLILELPGFTNKEHRILEWLDNVQERQDQGESWAAAVELADDDA